MSRPHNNHEPIDLRKHPVCYLCGVSWRLDGDFEIAAEIRKVVSCQGCDFRSFAKFDESVWDARKWPR
jgi:hypothetical protein